MEGKIEEAGSRWMPLKNVILVKEIEKVNKKNEALRALPCRGW